jgi:hypothetical protein
MMDFDVTQSIINLSEINLDVHLVIGNKALNNQIEIWAIEKIQYLREKIIDYEAEYIPVEGNVDLRIKLIFILESIKSISEMLSIFIDRI